jgi:hypothetical protein
MRRERKFVEKDNCAEADRRLNGAGETGRAKSFEGSRP